MFSTDDEWFADIVSQLQSKKGLSKEQAEIAATIYRREYIGQNAHALWQYAIEEAKKLK
ncbi:hypothetical protein [Vibrio sp. JZG120]